MTKMMSPRKEAGPSSVTKTGPASATKVPRMKADDKMMSPPKEAGPSSVTKAGPASATKAGPSLENNLKSHVEMHEGNGMELSVNKGPLDDAGPPVAGPRLDVASDPQEIPCPLLTPAGLLEMVHRKDAAQEMVACFPCNICDEVFSNDEHLTSHIETVH